jgi:uncharacterized Fe-S center protein
MPREKDGGGVARMQLYSSIDELPLPSFASSDTVAIKTHMGERGNTTHIGVDDLALLVGRVKEKGAAVFVTDTTTLYPRKRSTAEDYLETARLNGFTEDRVGCPIVIADSEGDRKVNGIHVARGLLDASALVVLSHATGHITTGFAGALKNIAMGCVSKRGKRYIHSAGWPRYREESCKKCGDCVEACPFDFLALDDRIELNLTNCPACERCLNACKNGGLGRPPGAMEECYRRYARTCNSVLSSFKTRVFINELNRITRFCDCTVNPDPIISPDLGLLVSGDPVALDRESARVIVEHSPDASEVFGEKWGEFMDNVSRCMQDGG